ncbi:heat-shock protein, partial [Trifolium medium]|nr:heat-shock protein [Trifolium medium]
CMAIYSNNELRVVAAVYMSGLQQPVIPAIEATMPMEVIDDGHFWHAEALNRTNGDTMNLGTLLKNE